MWGDVSTLEDLKKIILSIIVGIPVFVIVGVVACFLSDVGDSILQALNETGFTIPSSANYVAPIESLACSAFLILRTVSRLPGIIQIILAVVVSLGSTIAALLLLKRYDGPLEL
jgi:ABC-type antimicrobial peptide transport system permease subunit